jgi:hypothetical protein
MRQRLRRIPLSRRSHITGFQPLQMGTAEHESALERDFVTLTSVLDPGASIISQPITFKFHDGSRIRRYTPDFLVKHGTGRAKLIEVKYRADLRLQWTRLRLAFAAARDWAHEQGAMFRIATERSIRGVALENAKRLLPLRHVPLDVGIAELALAAVRTHEVPTFGAVLASLPMSRPAGLSTLWRLIAREALRVDLYSPITFETRLSLP